MAKLGEDVTEVLDYVPGHFQVIRHVRPKYACTACDAITQAPAPAMPTPRGLAARRARTRAGVEVCGSLACIARARSRRDGVKSIAQPGRLGGGRRGCSTRWSRRSDQSSRPKRSTATIPRCGLAPGWTDGNRTVVGTSAISAVWRTCGSGCLFLQPDRGAAHPSAHMASFTGFLQADGYAGSEGSTNSTHKAGRSSKLRVGLIVVARFSTCGKRRNRRLPRKHWIGSLKFMPSRTRPGSLLSPNGVSAPARDSTVAGCVLHLGRVRP